MEKYIQKNDSVLSDSRQSEHLVFILWKKQFKLVTVKVPKTRQDGNVSINYSIFHYYHLLLVPQAIIWANDGI